MQIVLLVLAFIFLGVIAPAFLIAIAAPWSFATTLAGWTVFASISLPLGWVALGKKRLV
jgi:membrane protease YdiL (CAAX protease family)